MSVHAQTDGRKPLPHILTAIISVVVSLAGAHFLGLAKTGPAGPPGVTTILTKTANTDGFCYWYGPDGSAGYRVQVSPAKSDTAGPYCAKGTFIDVTPGK